MNKKGFTLIELLAVIVILCITISIVVVQVEKNIKDTNEFSNEFKIKSIEDAAVLYVEEHRNELTNINEKKVDTISVDTLINSGLLSRKNLSDINPESIVLVAEINNFIKVKYTGEKKNIIFLNGPSEVTLYIGDEYKEMGAYVAIPGTGVIELKSSYINSKVNTDVAGKYNVTYSYPSEPYTSPVRRIVSVIN